MSAALPIGSQPAGAAQNCPEFHSGRASSAMQPGSSNASCVGHEEAPYISDGEYCTVPAGWEIFAGQGGGYDNSYFLRRCVSTS